MNQGAATFNLLDYFLSSHRLSAIGDNFAIEFAGEQITYNRLAELTAYYSSQLSKRGITRGDRVGLLLYDSPLFIACFLASASIGAISVPINTALTPLEVQFILADCQAKLVILEEELKAKLQAINAPAHDYRLIKVSAKDRACQFAGDSELRNLPALTQSEPARTTEETPAFMLYTSGSTGAPKGALHSHGAIPYTVEKYSKSVLRLRADDRVYSSSRLFFAYGLGNSLSFPLAAGAQVILDAARPNAERIAAVFEQQKPSVFFGVPAIYRSLLDWKAMGKRLDTSSLRLCVSAGEALPPRVFEDWKREFNLTILDGIGSTEMLHIFISNKEGEARPGASGKIIDGYEARLIDDSGNETKAGEAGNLWVKGKSATLGYWNRPDLTEATIQDGWVRTGDIYRRDEEGFFYHEGRSDDFFKVSGLWVSPIEVESILLEHELVQEAAVVSATGADGLATARAFVVIRKEGGGEEIKEELRNFLGSRLPRYKVPSQIDFINEMPRTSTGKIQRFKLRSESQVNLSGGMDDG